MSPIIYEPPIVENICPEIAHTLKLSGSPVKVQKNKPVREATTDLVVELYNALRVMTLVQPDVSLVDLGTNSAELTVSPEVQPVFSSLSDEGLDYFYSVEDLYEDGPTDPNVPRTTLFQGTLISALSPDQIPTLPTYSDLYSFQITEEFEDDDD